MLSIIIPAHNEQAVIRRCLTALLSGAVPGELEVIVVCNGCTDRTADVVRESWPQARVLETPIASKVHALNVGDAAARTFPRFYIDADVQLSLNELRVLAGQLEQPAIFAVAPRFRMHVEASSWAVRAFYEINDRLPSSREGIGGSGVYGLSERGRRRFEVFPDLTADDGFVRVQFSPHERRTVDGCESTVFAPRTLSDLVRIKTRSHFGSTELRHRYPQLWANRGQANTRELRRLTGSPILWPKLFVYAYVKLAARWGAMTRWRQQSAVRWDRDETSRAIPLPAEATK